MPLLPVSIKNDVYGGGVGLSRTDKCYIIPVSFSALVKSYVDLEEGGSPCHVCVRESSIQAVRGGRSS